MTSNLPSSKDFISPASSNSGSRSDDSHGASTEQSHSGLNNDLLGHVTYNDDTVMTNVLSIQYVQESVVESCVRALKSLANEIHFNHLRYLAHKEPSGEGEASKLKAKMYPHLVSCDASLQPHIPHFTKISTCVDLPGSHLQRNHKRYSWQSGL